MLKKKQNLFPSALKEMTDEVKKLSVQQFDEENLQIEL